MTSEILCGKGANLQVDAIVAVYSDWGIGANGTQPVAIPADRRNFAELTKGAAVIVGRKTLADLPEGLPLKGRFNVVMTASNITVKGAAVAGTVSDALEMVKNHEKVFVIGGESIYRSFFAHINRIFVTKLEICPHSDVFFENLDASPDWHCVQRGPGEEYEGIKYGFYIYERIGAG